LTITIDTERLGDELLELIGKLFPLNRSITGDGVRDTLRHLATIAPITMHEVPTGTRVLDWEVPREWNIADAYISSSDGRKIVDFKDNNLHVMSYSVPVRETLTREQLLPHLYSDPQKPDWIPYRTSYYADNWGFCLPHTMLEKLPDDTYEVVIDSTLEPGNLTYGEVLIPGKSTDECIIYTHTCHPSLCNDNLSGLAVCARLAAWLAERDNQLTYRIVFAPGTIGSITWLAQHEDVLPRIKHGLVVALVGNDQPLQYKRSRSGYADIDRVVTAYLNNEMPDATLIDFSPWGYDERQFGSPGFNLPVGRLTRSAEEGYPEYHTSADDLSLIDRSAIAESFVACTRIVEMLDTNTCYLNLAPKGEPQLGRRGIYRKTGGSASPQLQQALLWVLNMADGETDLVEIYRKSKLPYATLLDAVRLLVTTDLLEQVR